MVPLDIATSIQIARDVTLIVMSVLCAIILLLAYLKISKFLAATSSILKDIDSVVSKVTDTVMTPAAAGLGIVNAVTKTLTYLFGKRKGEKNGD